jgi:hypothetical protein
VLAGDAKQAVLTVGLQHCRVMSRPGCLFRLSCDAYAMLEQDSGVMHLSTSHHYLQLQIVCSHLLLPHKQPGGGPPSAVA